MVVQANPSRVVPIGTLLIYGVSDSQHKKFVVKTLIVGIELYRLVDIVQSDTVGRELCLRLESGIVQVRSLVKHRGQVLLLVVVIAKCVDHRQRYDYWALVHDVVYIFKECYNMVWIRILNIVNVAEFPGNLVITDSVDTFACQSSRY